MRTAATSAAGCGLTHTDPRRRKATHQVRKTFAAAAGTIVLAASLSACSTSPTGDTTTPSATSTSTGATAQASPNIDHAETWSKIKDFVHQVSGAVSAEAITGLRPFVAPGSPADRYLTHQANVQAAYTANGSSSTTKPTFTFADDDDNGTITITPPSTDASPTKPYTWSQFKTDPDGKIVSWTGASGPVESVLWTQDASGTGGGQTVTLKSAYKSNLGALFVVAEVTMNAYTADADAGPTYVAADGLTRTANLSSFPGGKVAKGSKALIVYYFDQAPLGGTMHYTALDGDGYHKGTVNITIQ